MDQEDKYTKIMESLIKLLGLLGSQLSVSKVQLKKKKKRERVRGRRFFRNNFSPNLRSGFSVDRGSKSFLIELKF